MIVNSHNNWSKLEEVWLGDVYPINWYDHLTPSVRDCFYELTEKTKNDLEIISNKLKEFGVVVRRPEYKVIDDHINKFGQLVKPQICPRDHFSVVGNTLRINDELFAKSWQTTLDFYRQHGADILFDPWFPASSSMVRIGRDLYLDFWKPDTDNGVVQNQIIEEFNNYYLDKFNDYRVHLLFNGGHIDGCFSAVHPGILLTTDYFSYYNETFPNWHCIHCTKPEFAKDMPVIKTNAPGYNGRWYLPDFNGNKKFNDHILQHAQDWVGDYTETYFEINCLVIDEKNILFLGEHESIFKELEKFGITAHSLPFRTRSFWDGALHCLTLDIRRQSEIKDYFPERNNQKLFTYN